MPVDKPKAGETQDEYLAYCIPEEIKSGHEQAQAAAICYSNWDKNKMSKIKDTTSKVMARINYDTKFEGINLAAPLEKGPNDPCYADYVQIGTKDLDGREVPNCVPLSKIEMELEQDGINFADYPWEQCVIEQTDRYGSKDIAEKVCGMIRSKYGS